MNLTRPAAIWDSKPDAPNCGAAAVRERRSAPNKGEDPMIVSSVRARIAKDTQGALQWSEAIAKYVAQKTGGEVEVLVRIGATQDVVWLQRFPDLAAFEKAEEKVQSDAGYWKRIKEAETKGFFDVLNVEAGIWRGL